MSVGTVQPKFASPRRFSAGPMGQAHAWAGRQINKAQKLIRELSQTTADHRDIRYEVQASDNNFFERITQTVDVDHPVDDELYTIKNLTINGDKRQLEALYVEALYTITHKVGKEECESKENLYRYVKAAFQGDTTLHNQLVEKAKQNKPPVVLLNCQLMEAKDLIAKDVNGFSDPFAMMGVIPGKRDASEVMDAQTEEEIMKSPRNQRSQLEVKGETKRDSVLHRFGGSFRRKVGGNKKKGSENSGIPAKYIKASSVQKKTLNPKWNEKFQFIVDDVQNDRFHIDIWDHDDEENSVLDAVSSLNQIKGGLKGLGRYFKEVTQSARADSDDSTDDFLGCVTLDLNDIPTDGVERWITLQPRSERSKVSGSVKLKVWLSTKEERICEEDDDMLDVKEHIELIRQFALYEIRQSAAPVRLWDGTFPDKALTILRQHAVQGDLTEVHSAMCRWLAFHSMINIDISFQLLFKSLQSAIDKWKPMTLDKEEEDMLTASFSSFDSFCKKVMMDHRTRFAPTKRNSGEEFACLVKCMKAMRDSPFYQKYLPYKRPFHVHLESLIVKSAEDFFDATLERVQDEDPCKELLKLISVINITCSKFLHFGAVIRELGKIDYSQLTLATFDKMKVAIYDYFQLSEYLTSELMSEKKTDLRTQMKISANQDPPNEDDLIDLIRIHMGFVELRNYRLANRVRVKDESEWYGIFNRGIKKFLDLIKERAFARIALSCQLDVPISTSSNDMKHSSSHIDVCHIIEQTTVCWERLDVNDSTLRMDYTKHLVDILCEIVTNYVKQIIANLESEGLAGELQLVVSSQLLQLLCSTVNNCEQVRRSLNVHEKLHLDDLTMGFDKENGTQPVLRTVIESRLEQCDQFVCSEIDRIIGLLTRRLFNQMKKHVFHLAWSPHAQPVEDSLKPLTDMLDIELSLVHKNLLHKNFLRVMFTQVSFIVKLMMDSLAENPGMEPTFYHRLFEAWHVLVDFFHAGGKGLSTEVLETTPTHVKLVKMLSLYQTPTSQLIEKYYKDLLKQQALAEHEASNEVSECKYGILNVRAYYNVTSQTLVLDVIGAKQVIPLDSNGLSDPFVVIEIVPRLRYPNLAVAKTKVVSKSLNPIFDETFEFNISPKLPPCAMIHFTVMDHDYLRSNDFAGEAFLELADVPGFGVAGGSTLRQFNLILIQPVSNSKEIMDVLSNRKDDKEATEFLRTINTSY